MLTLFRARHIAARATLLLAVISATMLTVALPAHAAEMTFLRTAHLSPDTPSVDVYVVSVADPANKVVLRGLSYGSVSPYQSLPEGSYTVSMRPAGAGEATPAVISTTLTAGGGDAYTVAGVGVFVDLGLKVLTDDLTLPPDGKAKIRVIQASAARPTLDIALDGGPTLATDVGFSTTTPYNVVEPGTWTLDVSGSDQAAVRLPVNVGVGSVYSVLILDSPTGLSVSLAVDAASTGVVPAGGVETGAGGTARAPLTPLLPVLALFLIAALTLRTTVRSRLRRTG